MLSDTNIDAIAKRLLGERFPEARWDDLDSTAKACWRRDAYAVQIARATDAKSEEES